MTLRLLQSLPAMSLGISIAVVICMAISFAALFFLYGRTKSKGVDFGVEDVSLKKELSDRLSKRENGTTYTQMLADGKKKEKIIRIITDVFLCVLILFVGGLTVFSFVLRSKGEQIYFGDTAYLTVLTSSMQEKNGNNPYLRENDDGVRIHQYALIGIDKVDPADLKEGDIIAFKYEGDVIYVHRIISVRQVGSERFFTTMGDANDISSLNETNISEDRIVGVFNGYHNGYLGVLLIYMRSDIGMVALIFVFLLLAVINAAEWLITRSYEKRQILLAAVMDRPSEPEPTPPVQTETVITTDTETDTEEDIEELAVAEDGVSATVTRVVYSRSFKARLILSDDTVKAYYGKLKNKILSYKKVRSAISWKHEAFIFSNKGTAVKLVIRGKTLCVRLSFAPEVYTVAGLKVIANGDGCFIRITGNITLGRAIKAIDLTMQKLGAVAGDEKSENYYLPYRTEEELLNENLIKKTSVKIDGSGVLKKPAGDNGD